MALIKCPECGKEISENATICPNCGNPNELVRVKKKSENTEHLLNEDTQSQTVDINNTAILEYFDIVKNEYAIEREKKQSFENRAGLLMALLGVLCIFLFEKIQLQDVFSSMTTPLTFVQFIKIFSGLSVYIFFILTLIMIIFTIIVKPHYNFDVKNIDEFKLGEPRISALSKIILLYRRIIIQHRDLNEKRAKTFRRSLYSIGVTIISIIFYISLT